MSLLLILSRYAERVQRKQSIKQSDIINVLNKVKINKKNDTRFNNRGSEASVNDSKYIKMTELQDFY